MGKNMGDEISLDVGELFAELGIQLRQNVKVALIVLALLVGGNLLIDQLGSKSSVYATGILEIAVQLYVMRAALEKAGLLPDNSKAKLGAFWWMGLISTLAIMIGCVLLILPGLYLAARWFLSGPVLIAEEKSAVESLRESWRLTRGSVWQLVGATLVLFGGGLAVAVVPFIVLPQSAQGVSLNAVAYIVMFGAYICGWLMEVGAYGMVTNRHGALAEVFA
ncbi:MAG TPA: glycerophosphoryl diester phosphodiesterase membrane domain-containing protein, partial [Bryobacteraceae bacterium]